uniref:N-acetyltransferase domain-containing protein n=1 Tax=Desulfovibrio sp. U5L TaxID=596152 RepID=I2Q6X2_9BACT
MEFDADLLREFLTAAGSHPDAVVGLTPGAALGKQGIAREIRAALPALLSEALGAPAPDTRLVEQGSLDDWAAFLRLNLEDATVKRAAVARIEAAKIPLPPDRAYEIDRMRPEDAPGVARLFHEIYGDKYPVVDYFVPEQLAALNHRNAVLTLVARLPAGEIAGIAAFYRSSPPNPAVYEQGQLLVAPEYRHTSIAFRLLKRLDEVSRSMTYAEAFFGEAVCNHLVTQKTAVRQCYDVCGLELSLMPSGAYAKEGASGRVSCLLHFRVDRDRHLPLYLPESYRPVLEHILSGFRLDRDVRYAADDVPSASQTILTSRVFDFAQVERVQVATLGLDFTRHVQEMVARACRQGLAVLQVYVNAGEPGVAFATEVLNREGFIFGGFAPLWFGPDALMFQWLAEAPDFAAINLLRDRAKILLHHLETDWRQHQGGRRHA